MDAPTEFTWEWFSAQMSLCCDRAKAQLEPLLGFFPRYDALVQRTLAREMSQTSDRPQDFVATFLVARAFRTTIAALRISLSGYADCVPPLRRSVDEIAFRLIQLTEDPVPASLGFLVHGQSEEVKAMESMVSRAIASGDELKRLPENLRFAREYLLQLRDIVRARGLDPDDLQQRFGHLKIGSFLRQRGLGHVYDIGYRLDSAYSHGNSTSWNFFEDHSGARDFNLGIDTVEIAPAVFDCLWSMLGVLQVSADLVGESALGDEADTIANEVMKVWENIQLDIRMGIA